MRNEWRYEAVAQENSRLPLENTDRMIACGCRLGLLRLLLLLLWAPSQPPGFTELLALHQGNDDKGGVDGTLREKSLSAYLSYPLPLLSSAFVRCYWAELLPYPTAFQLTFSQAQKDLHVTVKLPKSREHATLHYPRFFHHSVALPKSIAETRLQMLNFSVLQLFASQPHIPFLNHPQIDHRPDPSVVLGDEKVAFTQPPVDDLLSQFEKRERKRGRKRKEEKKDRGPPEAKKKEETRFSLKNNHGSAQDLTLTISCRSTRCQAWSQR